MKSIPLTQGKFTLVDDEDYKWLSQHKWYFHNGYAARQTSRLIGNRRVYMHRQIMNTPDDMETDHVNGDKLDNRRTNLRVCTKAENRRNIGRRSTNTSGYKGVCFRKDIEKWQAQITVNRKAVYLGYYNTPEEAARAYDEAAEKYYGKYARINA